MLQEQLWKTNTALPLLKEDVKVITDIDGSIYYNMLIERAVKENLKFENLVIKVKEDEMIASILKYTLSEKATYHEEHDTYNLDVINTESSTLVNESKIVACIIYKTPYCNDTSAGQEPGHTADFGCTISGYYVTLDCGGGASGGSFYTGGNNQGTTGGWTPNTNNGTGTHGGGFGNSGSTVITAPIVDDENVLASNFIANLDLSPEENVWLNNHFSIKLNVIDYLEVNHTQTDYDFVNEAIDALRNGGEVDYPNKIIYTINKPCQKQIVKDILAISSPLTNLIKSTFDSTDKVNLKFYNGTIPDGNPAQTNHIIVGTPPENYIIQIKFDDTYLDNATDLSIIAVTLHELVHAYLTDLYIKNQLIATDQSYNTLLNAFINFYKNKDENTYTTFDLEMHNAMKSFISKMANSIYNYALSKNITGVTPGFCEQLAWGTMNGTSLFQTSLTIDQQHDYETITAIEQDNIAGAKGTPCN